MNISKEEAQKLLDNKEISRAQYELWTAEPRQRTSQKTAFDREYESDGSRPRIFFSDYIQNNTRLKVNVEHDLYATFLEYSNGNRFEFQGRCFTLTSLSNYLSKQYGTDMGCRWSAADGIVPMGEWNIRYPKKTND